MFAEPLPARSVRGFVAAAFLLAVFGLLLTACSTSGNADGAEDGTADAAKAALPRSSSAPARSHTCGDLGYVAHTDNGAFGIKATGIECEKARRVASLSQGFPPTFTAHGFTCRTSGPQGELPSYPYSCTNGSARITFKAS